MKPRVPPTGCRLVINHDSCAACAACPAVCHSLALNMAALTLELNEMLCDNCSVCVYVCPTGALTLRGVAADN